MLLAFSTLCTTAALAQDSLCASVKIEIAQELTLERQAFDARMKINNGLDTIALQNVDVTRRGPSPELVISNTSPLPLRSCLTTVLAA